MTTLLELQLHASVRYAQEHKRQAKVLELRESFESGYVAEPNSGCWLWLRSLNNKGYGKLCGFGKERSELAHRFSYELHKGRIPDGLVIDHKCRTPACVNPDHLEAVTQQENMRRSPRSHVLRTGRCSRGHVAEVRNGRRYCKACNTLWHRNRKAKEKCRTIKACSTETTSTLSTCKDRTSP